MIILFHLLIMKYIEHGSQCRREMTPKTMFQQYSIVLELVAIKKLIAYDSFEFCIYQCSFRGALYVRFNAFYYKDVCVWGVVVGKSCQQKCRQNHSKHEYE